MIFTFGGGQCCAGKFVVLESKKEMQKIFGHYWAFEYLDTPEQRLEMHHFKQTEIKVDVAEKIFIVWRTRFIHKSLGNISKALDEFSEKNPETAKEIKDLKTLMDGYSLFELELEKISERSDEIVQKDRQKYIPDYYLAGDL